MSMPIKFTSAADFIAALEARRTFWEREDARRSKEHADAERKSLADWRERLKAAAKLTYAEASALTGSEGYGRYGEALTLRQPDCPILDVPILDDVLARLHLTAQKEFTVEDSNGWSVAYRLLTARPGVKRSPC